MSASSNSSLLYTLGGTPATKAIQTSKSRCAGSTA